MMARLTICTLLTLALIGQAALSYVIRAPRMSLLSPHGLRMAIDHEEGIKLFAVHYSINKPVPDVAAGDYNFDFRAPTGNEWVHENWGVIVRPGDVINYWILVVHNGLAHQLLDQSWVVPASAKRNSSTGTNRHAPSETNAGCTNYPCLVFEDNFDSLNFANWEHEITAGGYGNWEFEYYTNNRTNSYVRDGNLYIKPTLTADRYGESFLSSGNLDIWGNTPADLCTGNGFYGCARAGTPTNYINPIQSARLRTASSFTFTYGRVEVEAQMPTGDWIWPAIWAMPRYEEYGGWPASGEIDIVESRGNRKLKDEQGESFGCDYAGSTMHWGPFFPYNGFMKTTKWVNNDFADRMHKYALEWDETGIKTYIDDVQTLHADPGPGGFWKFGDFGLPDSANPWKNGTKMTPFDRPFYLIMNVAVGGTNGFFNDNHTNYPYPKPWRNQSPTAARDFWEAKKLWYPTWNPEVNNGEDAAMKVNYVRVWKMKP